MNGDDVDGGQTFGVSDNMVYASFKHLVCPRRIGLSRLVFPRFIYELYCLGRQYPAHWLDISYALWSIEREGNNKLPRKFLLSPRVLFVDEPQGSSGSREGANMRICRDVPTACK